jgi:PPOX class probable F420-dependent enzyme
VHSLLTARRQGPLFVAGTSTRQGRFYPLLDHIVLLTVPEDVARERLASRTTNDYGKNPAELRRELHLRSIVEPMLRRSACLEVDTAARSPAEVAALITDHTRGRSPRMPTAGCHRRNRVARGGVGPAMTAATEFDPHGLLAESRLGVLATIKSDGRPQLSPVTPFYDREAGVIFVSVTEGRAKTANLRRDPRASLEVTSPEGWAWATAEGTASLIGPGTDPHGPEVDALVEYYRKAAGEHPDWDEYRSVMVSDRRVLLVMSVDRVYGAKVR